LKTPHKIFRIKIIFLGPIRSIVKRSEDYIILDGENPTLRNVIEILSERYGDQLKQLLLHDRNLNRSVLVFINSEKKVNDLDFLLEDETQLEILLVSQAVGG